MGEFELLAMLRERLPASGPRVRLGSGDDAAVTVPGGATATSVDAIVDGVHFRRAEATPAQVGHKALASALSDLAAMGAEAGEAYVVLGVPEDLGEAEFLALLDGLLALAGQTGTTLAGGDLTAAPALSLTVTVVGHAPTPELLIPRSGARPGDALLLTGEIGAAAAGLLLLDQPELGAALPDELTANLRRRQLEPLPQLAAGQALAAAGAHAMIDLSDGLGADAGHLASQSGVALQIDAASLPVADGVAEVALAAGRDPLELAASGGEDYELLATLAPEQVEAAEAALGGVRVTRIGAAHAGEGVEIRRPEGEPLRTEGYDHLRSRRQPRP